MTRIITLPAEHVDTLAGRGEAMTANEVACALGASPESVRVTVRRLGRKLKARKYGNFAGKDEEMTAIAERLAAAGIDVTSFGDVTRVEGWWHSIWPDSRAPQKRRYVARYMPHLGEKTVKAFSTRRSAIDWIGSRILAALQVRP